MTFQTNQSNGAGEIGSGSESAMDMVLDNLGMEDELAGDVAGLEQDTGEGDDESFESNEQIQQSSYEEPRQRQQQRQQPQPQQRQQPRPLPQQAEVRADQRGNLIGPDGKIVAKAGFEARMYQETVRARQGLQQEQARTRDVTGRLTRAVEIGQQLHNRVEQLQAQLNDRNTAPARLGLNDQETIQGLQLVAEAKRDPVNTLKKILTMAASAGVDLSKIGIAPGGVDSKSLLDMVRNEIAQHMNPLNQRMATERQQHEQIAQAATAYRETEREGSGFFDQNPDAKPFIPVFHAVLSEPQFQHMSLGEVWAKIQLNQMRQSQQNGNGHVRQNPQQRRNLPSGRGQPYNPGTGDMAPVSQSYDSILRETLDQLGVV